MRIDRILSFFWRHRPIVEAVELGTAHPGILLGLVRSDRIYKRPVRSMPACAHEGFLLASQPSIGAAVFSK
jgi:hypothetical protein